jgi:hypothetical protein
MTIPPIDPEDVTHSPEEDPQESSGGINLPLVYSLIVLAMVLAIGCALLIVRPFYQRIH